MIKNNYAKRLEMKAKNIHILIRLAFLWEEDVMSVQEKSIFIYLLYARYKTSKNTTVKANKHFHEEIYFYDTSCYLLLLSVSYATLVVSLSTHLIR